MEIKPDDVIISVLTEGSWIVREVGVQLYHKPTDKTYQCSAHRSQYRNRAECFRMLEEDLCYLDL